MKTSFFAIVLLVSCGFTAMAQEGATSTRFSEYFTVSEPKAVTTDTEMSSAPEISSLNIFWDQIDHATTMGARLYSLLQFDLHKEEFGNVVEPYKRLKHFGAWIKPGTSCKNTRAVVLERDSSSKVSMNPSGCSVSDGQWDDPYTGRTFRDARDIQIDHFVPLKNAYVSGADKWTSKRRCLYANYLGNEFHLLAVSGRENMSKGDRGPQDYMPPNRAYYCQYLSQWLKVKAIWALGLTPPEKEAVTRMVQDNHCSAAELAYTQEDLRKQRDLITKNMGICR